MTVWTHQELRRLAATIQRQVTASPQQAILLAPGQHIGEMTLNKYAPLCDMLTGIPFSFVVAERNTERGDKAKIDILLFGHDPVVLWKKVKDWAHEIQVKTRHETESFRDDEYFKEIEAFNDAVIEHVAKVRRVARQKIETKYAINLGPKKVTRHA